MMYILCIKCNLLPGRYFVLIINGLVLDATFLTYSDQSLAAMRTVDTNFGPGRGNYKLGTVRNSGWTVNLC